MDGSIDSYGMTDVGQVRDSNEDHFLIADLKKSVHVHRSSLDLPKWISGGAEGHLMLVADGLGGHRAGELASRVAVETLLSYIINAMPWFFHLDEECDGDFRAELKQAFHRCEERVRSVARDGPGRRGMGTTLTAAYLIWPRLYVAHVGDSRCYLFRRDQLRQLTHDHSVAQKLRDSGKYGESELLPRWHHTLWNVIGGNSADSDPELKRIELQAGDYLVLCTDGLTKHLDDAEIANQIDTNLSARDLCERLMQMAVERGGRDNVTVLTARFADDQSAPDVAEVSCDVADPAALGDTIPFPLNAESNDS